MDFSKLPKLSRTGESQPAPNQSDVPEASPTPPAASAPAPAAGGGFFEAWLSIGIGAFVLLIQPRFLQWLSSRIFHTSFNEFTDPDTNNVVPYTTVPEFWSDLGVTLFGVVLILDGLLIFTRRKSLCWVALVITVVSTVYNLLWLVGSYSKYGLPVVSFLAVIFGVFMAGTQWRIIQSLGGKGPSPRAATS